MNTQQQIEALVTTAKAEGTASGQVGTMKVTISRKSGVETDEPMPEPFPPDPGSEHDDSWWR